MSAQGLISISERAAIREHATATVTALLAGRRIFEESFDERIRLLQLVRGVHGLHVYATEFWIEYLLSDAKLSSGLDVFSNLFALASRLAKDLSTNSLYPLPKELTIHPVDIDERLQLFQEHHLLYEQMKAALNSRSRKRLEAEVFQKQGTLFVIRDVLCGLTRPKWLTTLKTAVLRLFWILYRLCFNAIKAM